MVAFILFWLDVILGTLHDFTFFVLKCDECVFHWFQNFPYFRQILYLELMYHPQYQPEISTDAPISNLGECDPLDLLVTGNHIVAKY